MFKGIEESLLQLVSPGNIFLLSLFLFVIIVIYIFIFKRKKEALQNFIDEKVKVFKNVFYISEDVVVILSHTNEILYANKAAIDFFDLKKYFKFTILELPKIKIKNKFVNLNTLITASIEKSEKRMNVYVDTFVIMGDNEEKEIPINLYFNTVFMNMKDNIPGTILIINDIRKEKEQVLEGYKHKLTKLPNQVRALSDLNALYAKLHLKDKKIALVLMDIDNFSMLRSIIGYEQSNVVLIRFASYLKELADEFSFSVYHTVHNNFLLVIQDIESSKDILSIVNNIQYELKSFYTMGNSKLHLTASIGVSLYPDSSTTLNLLDDAYKALSTAEKKGHGQIEIYDENNPQYNYDELKLYNDMHQALEKSEFIVYYQPIVDAKTEKIVSAEALIRWQHSEHGLISPDVFIPIMEKTGFIRELGQYVLEEVLKQQKRWELFKFKQVPISINLSLLELESGKFVENVIKKLVYHQVSAKLIKFEITEGSAMVSEERTIKQLTELKRLDIEISLDDFGTGYTSFTYLKKIPANILKIDRSLVMHMVENEEDQRIVKAIIELGHNIGMKVIVEGIENEEMFLLAQNFGSDFIQGFHFSKPLPIFEFQKLLR